MLKKKSKTHYKMSSYKMNSYLMKSSISSRGVSSPPGSPSAHSLNSMSSVIDPSRDLVNHGSFGFVQQGPSKSLHCSPSHNGSEVNAPRPDSQ